MTIRRDRFFGDEFQKPPVVQRAEDQELETSTCRQIWEIADRSRLKRRYASPEQAAKMRALAEGRAMEDAMGVGSERANQNAIMAKLDPTFMDYDTGESQTVEAMPRPEDMADGVIEKHDAHQEVLQLEENKAYQTPWKPKRANAPLEGKMAKFDQRAPEPMEDE